MYESTIGNVSEYDGSVLCCNENIGHLLYNKFFVSFDMWDKRCRKIALTSIKYNLLWEAWKGRFITITDVSTVDLYRK